MRDLIAGVDESGRGCLAGPVVATAVILTDTVNHYLFKDSKSLTALKRDLLYKTILSATPYISTCVISHREIDGINILQATMNAMKTAILHLKVKPSRVLIDGNKTPDLKNYRLKAIVKGDQKEPCISAASIIAKVTRDRIMDAYHYRYKAYQFNDHKGYGTVSHYDALFKLGPSPIHRLSFNLTKQLRLI